MNLLAEPMQSDISYGKTPEEDDLEVLNSRHRAR